MVVVNKTNDEGGDGDDGAGREERRGRFCGDVNSMETE